MDEQSNVRESYSEQLIAAIKEYHPSPNLELIAAAAAAAERLHKGQVRASGEPFVNHVFETALLVAQLKLDEDSIAAALLHDAIEDCGITADDIASQFGSEISLIVEGVTKLTRIEFESREEKQAENFRKMLLAMAKDIRVVLIKLCDRLHNMRTLSSLSERKQRAIASETQEIYAPIANRLGIYWLKSELEDQSLKYLRPEIYKLIDDNFRRKELLQHDYIEKVCDEIKALLATAGVSAAVSGRVKHYYSIWRKMEELNLGFDEVYDYLGFRVVVPTIRACYESLGVVHSSYKPIPGMFKDYIAMPKPNMYQSLHTRVIGPEGQRIEVQIRTPEMHRIAEEGIAAHWKYKEGKLRHEAGFDLHWIKDLVENQSFLKTPDEFIEQVKTDLFPEEVFVFTPKGDLIRLPYSSTPIDFGYAIHSDVGNSIVGAKCNGQMVPLSHKLENGDTVEVLTAKNHMPSKDWLKYAATGKARQKIRGFIKQQEMELSRKIGEEMLAKDLKRVRINMQHLVRDKELKKISEQLGFDDMGELYGAIGYGRLSTAKIISLIEPSKKDLDTKLAKNKSQLSQIVKNAAHKSRSSSGIVVGGFDDLVVRFARCCQPIPGDRVIGFITIGRGVSIHRADCSQIHGRDNLRKIEVGWDAKARVPRQVKIIVHTQNQPGVLAKISDVIASNGSNINAADVKTNASGKAVNSFEIVVFDAKQFDAVRRGIELVPGVIKVERILT